MGLGDFAAVNETKNLLETLKRCLRARGVTYHKLGRALGLSESSVKRLFADESFTLARLEKVCGALDMSVADLVRMAAGTREAQTFSLTLEQERTLASDASLLALFYLLLNGRSAEAAERGWVSMHEQCVRCSVGWSEAQLIEVDAKRKVRLHARLPIAWRPDGPVRKLYERQVRAEFLQRLVRRQQRSVDFSLGRAVAGVGAHPAAKDRQAGGGLRRPRCARRPFADARQNQHRAAAGLPAVGVFHVLGLPGPSRGVITCMHSNDASISARVLRRCMTHARITFRSRRSPP